MNQANTNKTWMVSIALQGKVEQGWLCKEMWCRVGQGRACKCKAGVILQFYRRGRQSEILKKKISCPSSIQSVYLLCVMAPKNDA